MTGTFARLLLIWSVAVLVAGCVTEPDAYLIGPIHLRVLDARSLSPIAGTEVTAISPADPSSPRRAVSGPQGMVSIAPLRGGITMMPFVAPPPVMLSVTAKGYGPYSGALPDTGA